MPSLTLRTNLEIEYLMCPGSGQVVPDTSGNSRDGALGASLAEDTDDPSWVSNGIYLDNAGYFETPDQFVTGVGLPLALNESTFFASYYDYPGITFEMWVKVDSITAIGDYRTLMSLTGQQLYLIKRDGSWYTHFSSWYDTDNPAFVPVGYTRYPAECLSTGVTPFPMDEWVHVVITRDGEGVNHYLNGVLDYHRQLSLQEFTDAFNVSPDPAQVLGGDGEEAEGMFLAGIIGGSPSFPGRIGEARVYSAALSDVQVLANYNASNYYPDGKNSCTFTANRWYAL